MQKITPFLWFDNQAEEAVNFYTSLFKKSKIGDISRYDKAGAEVSGRKEGSVMTVGFELCAQPFVALNGGPLFPFSPAISFSVSCETEEEINTLWEKLSEGGNVMMELTKYPFSERYGWLSDKFGVSWQLNLTKVAQKITPSLLFVGEQFGKTEEAIKFYTSLFQNSNIQTIARYEKGEEDKEGNIKYSLFTLDDVEFIAMESSLDHKFSFTQAISFIINCESQEEVDKFWDAFSDGGQIQQCGWVVDKYGVPWQVVPTILDKLLADPDPVKAQRVMAAMLKMVKLDIEGLKQAYNG